MKKKVGGRPKSKVTRNRYLPVRVSVEEIDAVKSAASDKGLTVTDYVRRRLKLGETGYGANQEDPLD